jgi:hypothetical protein
MIRILLSREMRLAHEAKGGWNFWMAARKIFVTPLSSSFSF